MPIAYNYDWIALIEEQQASGMNMKRFCKEKDLPYQCFKNHKYALQSATSDIKTFIPVKADISHHIQFTLNGNTICFDSSLNDETISRIVKALLL